MILLWVLFILAVVIGLPIALLLIAIHVLNWLTTRR